MFRFDFLVVGCTYSTCA